MEMDAVQLVELKQIIFDILEHYQMLIYATEILLLFQLDG